MFLQLADPAIGRRSLLARTLITFVLLTTIRETLRGAIMSGVVTGGWAASALGLAEPLLRLVITTLLCVLAQRWVRGAASLVLVALATGALVVGAYMLLGAALAPLREAAAALGRPALYEFPYPAQVMIPAYLTFIEAVLGAALLLMLVWDQLPGTLALRLLAAALLVALLKGIVGVTFLFSFFMDVTPLAGMLGYSQFLFEFLALGLLAGLAWEAFGGRRDGRA